eukprot:1069463-Prymnesium_polylepis.1
MSHPAVVYIPYQVSTISFFELYRAGMPLFIPSLALMERWTHEHDIIWERIYGTPPRLVESDEPESPHTMENLHYWLGLSDFYHFPHVQLFDSWSELLHMLQTVDLQGVSRQMQQYNSAEKQRIKGVWSDLLERAVLHSSSPLHSSLSGSFDKSMTALWGRSLPTVHIDERRCRPSTSTE